MNKTKFVRMMVMAIAAVVGLMAQAADTSIAYQGVLKDAQGGTIATLQQTVEFRLYKEATGGTALWGRSVAVLLDTNGLFNVSLEDGNGSALEGMKYEKLLDAIRAARSTTLYVGLNVVGSSGEISPRQKLLQVPYAAYAYDVESASGDFTVSGTAKIKDLSVEGTATFKNVNFEGSTTFTKGATFNGNVSVSGSSSISGYGTIPVGGIIMWSGDSVPDGWALCDGNNGTPDLRGRFVMGAKKTSYGYLDVGEKGGKDYIYLTAGQLPAHRHLYFGDDQLEGRCGSSKDDLSDVNTTTVVYNQPGGYDADSKKSGSGKNYYTSANLPGNKEDGIGKGIDILPPYYKLAFIMRKK
jgi:hypothetical protein